MEFEVTYDRLSSEQFKYMVQILLLCSDYKISPKINKIISDNHRKTIIYEKYPYTFIGIDGHITYNILEVLGITIDKFIAATDQKIMLMHSLGIGHGDLHLGNIVFNYDSSTHQIDIRIIDLETAYYIVTAPYNQEILNTASIVLRIEEDSMDNKQLSHEWVEYDYKNYKYNLGLNC